MMIGRVWRMINRLCAWLNKVHTEPVWYVNGHKVTEARVFYKCRWCGAAFREVEEFRHTACTVRTPE